MVVGAQLFRQNTWFLRNYRAFSKLSWEILHYFIRMKKLSKKLVQISQFYIKYLSHLNVWLVSDQEPLVLDLRTLPWYFVPPNMWRRSDVSSGFHIGWDVADHAKMSSWRHNLYVNGTHVFETSLRCLTGT